MSKKQIAVLVLIAIAAALPFSADAATNTVSAESKNIPVDHAIQTFRVMA